MNRNQKIAIGCGAAGCLGLIIVAVASVIAYVVYQRGSVIFNANRDSSYNLNANRRSRNRSDSSPNPSSSGSTFASSMSDDDKHKLFQAAGMTKDNELIQRVLTRIGFMKTDGTTTDEYEQFVKDHFAWAMKNLQFINSVNTPDKARAYINEHIDE